MKKRKKGERQKPQKGERRRKLGKRTHASKHRRTKKLEVLVCEVKCS